MLIQKQLINGKLYSKILNQTIIDCINTIHNKFQVKLCLAIIIIGNNPSSLLYIRNKMLMAKKIGVGCKLINYNASVSQDQILDDIDKLNKDNSITGILIQLPLPNNLDKIMILNSILPYKDVDGFGEKNSFLLSRGYLNLDKIRLHNNYLLDLFSNTNNNYMAIIPCTAIGVLRLIQATCCNIFLKQDFNLIKYSLDKVDVKNNIIGKKILIVGCSNIVGKPTAELMLHERATITIAHKETKNLEQEFLNNEIIILATGVAGLLNPKFIRDNSIIIDVGISKQRDSSGSEYVCGDFNSKDLQNQIISYSPVPGGVGPMTISCLFENLILCYYNRSILV